MRWRSRICRDLPGGRRASRLATGRSTRCCGMAAIAAPVREPLVESRNAREPTDELDAATNSEIVRRNDVRPTEIENQEDVGGPQADAGNARQGCDDLAVRHGGQLICRRRIGIEPSCQISDVTCLCRRHAGRRDAARRLGEDAAGTQHALNRRPESPVNSGGGGVGHSLIDDRANQRLEWRSPRRRDPLSADARDNGGDDPA